MFQKKKTKPNKSDEKGQKLILQTDVLEREREAGLETSPKLETSTQYVMNLGYTSYSAPKFLCRYFSATVSYFPILLKNMANLPTL